MDTKRRRYIEELEEASSSSLSAKSHEHLRNALKDYYRGRDVERFVYRLTSLLNTPQKLDLLKKVAFWSDQNTRSGEGGREGEAP